MVENNIITNYDINADNIKSADTIWGPTEYMLQGKMKRKRPNTHNNTPKLALPVSQQHKHITMYIEIFMSIESLFYYQKQGN